MTGEESSFALMETSDVLLVVLEVALWTAVMFVPVVWQRLDLPFEDEVAKCLVAVVMSWVELGEKNFEIVQVHQTVDVQPPLPEPVPEQQLLQLRVFGDLQGLHLVEEMGLKRHKRKKTD